MSFKPYCLALTDYGPRAFPVQAFQFFTMQETPCSWAARIVSPVDEECFVKMFKQYAWLVKSARRRGFGTPLPGASQVLRK